MYPIIAERGTATSVEPIIFRTLRREYRLHPPSPAARQALLFMEARPHIAERQLEPVDIDIAARHGFLTARLPDGKLVSGTSLHVLSALHELALWDHLESHGDWPIMHGASVIVGGRRLLLIGDKGLGKSTLAAYLASKGHDVEGDEHVGIGTGSVIARPRTLRLKPGTFALLETQPEELPRTPYVRTWDGIAVHAVDPSIFGRPWRIAEGPLAACIVLAPNRGGRSLCKSLSTDACFAALMANSHFGNRNVMQLAVRLRALAASVPAYALQLGDLPNARWHLEQLAAA